MVIEADPSTDTGHRWAIKRAAELEIASALESRKQILDEHSAAFRWLTASLLAVNGGAIIALANGNLVQASSKIAPCGSFFLGIMAALLTALLSQHANRGMLAPINQALGYYVVLAQTGEQDADVESKVRADLATAMVGGKFTQIAGWCSAAFFCVGVILAGFSAWGGNGEVVPKTHSAVVGVVASHTTVALSSK